MFPILFKEKLDHETKIIDIFIISDKVIQGTPDKIVNAKVKTFAAIVLELSSNKMLSTKVS